MPDRQKTTAVACTRLRKIRPESEVELGAREDTLSEGEYIQYP